jgi:hypothetical protein
MRDGKALLLEASVKADADGFAKNVAPIIREIKSTGVASHSGIARSLDALLRVAGWPRSVAS